MVARVGPVDYCAGFPGQTCHIGGFLFQVAVRAVILGSVVWGRGLPRLWQQRRLRVSLVPRAGLAVPE